MQFIQFSALKITVVPQWPVHICAYTYSEISLSECSAVPWRENHVQPKPEKGKSLSGGYLHLSLLAQEVHWNRI